MRLVTYSTGGDRRVGFLVGDRVCDLQGAADGLGVAVPPIADLRDAADLRHLPALSALASAAAAEAPGAPWSSGVGDVRLHAPYRPVQNVICAGGNTRDEHHADRIRGGRPWLNYYTKAPSATADPGTAISWPRHLASQVHAEPELAVVIGAPTSYVEPGDVPNHVFGYAVATNVAAADLKRKHGQWDKAVSLDTFLPWGPVVVTADEVDLSAVSCRLWLNDRMALTGAVEAGLLSTAEVISQISFGMSLQPGDVVLTGVAEGVGHGTVPERWLADGDVVRSAVDGIGEIENVVETYGRT